MEPGGQCLVTAIYLLIKLPVHTAPDRSRFRNGVLLKHILYTEFEKLVSVLR